VTRDLILAIETSNPSARTSPGPVRPGIAVGRLGPHGIRLLARREIDPGHPHDDSLLPAIDAAFRSIAAPPAALARVAVSIGPGGYTAVRLAVTAAMMIAEATGAQCVPVPTASVVARRVTHGPLPFAVLLASKGDSAFATVFDADRPADAGRLVRPADIAALRVRRLIADSFLPEAIRLAAGGVPIEPPVFDPAACLELAIDFDPVDPMALRPRYPREPEAVTRWRELHPPDRGAGGSDPTTDAVRSGP